MGVQINREVQIDREIINREKSSIGHDEEEGIILSPVRAHFGMEKDSMDTSSTSKSRIFVEDLTVR